MIEIQYPNFVLENIFLVMIKLFKDYMWKGIQVPAFIIFRLMKVFISPNRRNTG